MIFFASNVQILTGIAEDILRIYSSLQKYKKIYECIVFFKIETEITRDMYKNINYGFDNKSENVEFFDLERYTIYVFDTCKCHV